MSLLTVEQLYEEAMKLPPLAKASLVERLVRDVGVHVDPKVERAHLALVKARIEEVESGGVAPIDGASALEQARRLLER